MATTKRSVTFLAVLLALLIAAAFMPLLSDSMQSHAASKLKVSKSSVTVEYGKTVKVTAKGLSAKELKKVTWTSSDKSIATVKGKGKTATITPVYNGTATVTAKYKNQKAKVKVTVTVDNPSVTGNYQAEGTVYALLYQESAEVAALQMQAFNLAKLRLDQAIEKNKAAGKNEGEGLAIVTDIDSTIMDDTCYIAGAVLDSAGRIAIGLEPWHNDDWCGYYHAVATTADTVIPGALKFMKYADSKGVKVYYITNRPYYELDLTVQQLKTAGFPVNADAYAGADEGLFGQYVPWDDPDLDAKIAAVQEQITAGGNKFYLDSYTFTAAGDYQVQVQGSGYSSKKTARRDNVRDQVGGEANIVMYLGDSINDMISNRTSKYAEEGAVENGDFDRSLGTQTRTANAKKYESYWGDKFIVLPNATYGDWYKTVWNGSMPASRAEQEAGILDQIYSYSYLGKELWYNGKSAIGDDVQ